ncbi:hypothetical protein TCAL_07975 [Tigriopus californicus]|uniref:Protein kinase domain-containing protein n=1 Tax=Tigriopus californicus TaxID=6832 RepID=A0A553N7E8_TIGCA|nr:glycogen synthase kinase-3-like [Tigriopus californicus]TRY61366.1 hypothetical protein TCAL_07975 [Tigriopus californicus]|eukprot:TCALIF_07975-PA protein Name:"Similar to RIM11 Serine/threonine-protein kinase RIM11/MSD1 (Saccharomyces cerevisiae (strain ATCC 204508 / S288c))" AED:0.08 eAED:0.08 QI:0/0/0/1/1/1/2/0/379
MNERKTWRKINAKAVIYPHDHTGAPPRSSVNDELQTVGPTKLIPAIKNPFILGPRSESVKLCYQRGPIVGSGCFGLVFKVKIRKFGFRLDEHFQSNSNMDQAALKIVVVKRRENRELSILKTLNHENIVKLHFYSFSRHDVDHEEAADGPMEEVCLNMFFEFMPLSLFDEIQSHPQGLSHGTSLKYLEQLAIGLQYLHDHVHVCHRDIKPSNLLVSADRSCLKICDFGSATVLSARQTHVSYVCSRYYRAPELLLGSEDYDERIDIWSVGCVLGEMIGAQVVFKGEDNMDQLVEIIHVLGTLEEDVLTEMKVPIKFLDQSVLASRLTGTFPERLQTQLQEHRPDAIFEGVLQILCDILQYIPQKRPRAVDILYNLAALP